MTAYQALLKDMTRRYEHVDEHIATPEQLVNQHRPWALRQCKKYLVGSDDSKAEILMAALEGLFYATKNFDPNKGRFITFSKRYIQKSIQKVYEQRRSVTISTSAYKNGARFQKKEYEPYIDAEDITDDMEKFMTQRQIDVLRMLMEGNTLREIADNLGISKSLVLVIKKEIACVYNETRNQSIQEEV